MLKLLFVLSLTALLFLVLLGLIRSKVEPKSTMRRRMERLETLAEERKPFAQPRAAQPEEKKQAGGFKQMLAALSTALTPLRLRPSSSLGSSTLKSSVTRPRRSGIERTRATTTTSSIGTVPRASPCPSRSTGTR